MAEGFFGRWSQRKEAVRKGERIAEEAPQELAPRVPPPQPSPERGGSEDGALAVSPPSLGKGQGGGAPAAEPPPTLEDAQSLTKDSDFTRFVRPDVAPEVKNTALKKLFTDPHFNTMDGLDVYIDDYGKADPLPPEMLRKMVSAKFLKLFDDEEEKDEDATGSGSPDADAPDSVAQSGTRTAQALPPAEDHADPDLRLQQDDAPGPEGPGAGSR